MTDDTAAVGGPGDDSGVDQCDYFAACTIGLEEMLEQELRALGATDLEPRRGGWRFRGDKRLGYSAALWLRTAVRLQERLGVGEVTSEDELYDFVRGFDWQEFLRIDQTLAVDASVRDACLTHSRYAALKVKDAIVDQFRERDGRRPNVDPKRPILPLKLHLERDTATLYRDLSGESLHKRGYRPIQVKSPLNEAIAAGIVMLSGWDGRSRFCDPMCGSATIAIEAAWIAADRAPGLRRSFAFERWLDFDADAWREMVASAMKRMQPDRIPPIDAADRHPGAIAIARDAVRDAGLRGRVALHDASLDEFEPDDVPAHVVTNAPYGERLGRLGQDDLERSWEDLGDFLRDQCRGGVAHVLCGNPSMGRVMRLKASRKYPIRNGPIDCRLLRYEIRADGSVANPDSNPDAKPDSGTSVSGDDEVDSAGGSGGGA